MKNDENKASEIQQLKAMKVGQVCRFRCRPDDSIVVRKDTPDDYLIVYDSDQGGTFIGGRFVGKEAEIVKEFDDWS